MKTLLLMRHAKSSWDNPGLSDFDRPLNSRGLESAPLMGNIIYQNNLQPDTILSSPAKRAKQTAILVKEVAEINTKIEFQDKIYEASPTTLFQVVSEIEDTSNSVLLLGHNPGLEEFLRILTNEIQPLPTASLAIIKLNIQNWRQIKPDCGFLELVIRPKDLQERVKIERTEPVLRS